MLSNQDSVENPITVLERLVLNFKTRENFDLLRFPFENFDHSRFPFDTDISVHI